MKLTYKKAGVDLELGDRCSNLAYRAALKTFAFRQGLVGRPVSLPGGFSGPLYIKELKDAYLVKNSDGVGSKAIVAQLVGNYATLAYDLIAMVADDAAAIGAEPIAATNTLDMRRLDEGIVKSLMSGVPKACKEARIVMVGGEIAELGDQVRGVHKHAFIWNADVVGVLERNKLIDGSKVRAGHSIVAIRSNGIRSNGLTLARKILAKHFGKEWFLEKEGKRTWGMLMLKPSRILSKFLVELVGAYGKKPKAPVSAIIHVTGGGVPANLLRVLKRVGLGAELDALFTPQREFFALQEFGRIDDREAYRTWNMGQCALIITPNAEIVLRLARDQGLKAKLAGKVTRSRNITLHSMALNEEKLVFKT